MICGVVGGGLCSVFCFYLDLDFYVPVIPRVFLINKLKYQMLFCGSENKNLFEVLV